MASGTYVKITVVLSDGTTTEEEINVRNGDDAFEVWAKDNPGGTKEDYYEFIKGDTGPANTLTIGSVTTGAPTDPASATITGDAPNQVLNLTIPQGIPGKVTTVDGITDRNGNVLMAPAATIYTSGTTTLTPGLTNVRDVSIYINSTGTITINLAAWSAEKLHPRINVRIACIDSNGSTGKITFVTGGGTMWRLNGTYGAVETIALTRNIQIFDVMNTFGSAPAIARVYPGPSA